MEDLAPSGRGESGLTMFRASRRYLPATVAALIVAGAARADLTAATTRTRPGGAARPAAATVDALAGMVLPGGGAIPTLPPVPTGPRAAEPRGELLTLTPGPSSVDLFLWALGGLGAWQLGRSARRVHWAALPSWYHAGGPQQIGHATPLDPSFHHAALPVVGFSRPMRPRDGATLWCVAGDEAAGLCARFLPSELDPRGPPVHS